MTAEPPRPKRKVARKRKLPPMPEVLHEWVEDARQRMESRPPSPGIAQGPDGKWTSPHADADAWWDGLCSAFGTRSASTVTTFVLQLVDITRSGVEPDVKALNAALNIVNGARPRNELEAALVAQMVATHLLTMRCGAAAQRAASARVLAAWGGVGAGTLREAAGAPHSCKPPCSHVS